MGDSLRERSENTERFFIYRGMKKEKAGKVYKN
jgi:hypothetical protein